MELNNVLKQKLEKGSVLSAADFMAAYPELSEATVYSRIRSLVRSGYISPVGKGRYRLRSKQNYRVVIPTRMAEVNNYLNSACEGINHCVTMDSGNLLVQVPKGDVDFVLKSLKKEYSKVLLEKTARQLPIEIDGYIFVGVLVSDAPLLFQDGVAVSSLEKRMVDMVCAHKKTLGSLKLPFQKLLDVYPVNYNRMNRYASRRGVARELTDCLSAIDMSRVDMFTKVQEYLSGTHITKAWVFGSFARCEEDQSSDLDLLVEYDHNSSLSLLGFNRYKLDIENIIKRDVDLVVNGTLLPFAKESSERDKYLLYER